MPIGSSRGWRGHCSRSQARTRQCRQPAGPAANPSCCPGPVGRHPHGCHHGQTTHPISVAHRPYCPGIISSHNTHCGPQLWDIAGHSAGHCRDTLLLHLVALGQPELQVPGVEVSTLGTASSSAAIPYREWELLRHLQPWPPRAPPVPGELRASLHGHRWFCSSTGCGWAAFG